MKKKYAIPPKFDENPTWHSNISYSHIFFMFLIFILKHETWYIYNWEKESWPFVLKYYETNLQKLGKKIHMMNYGCMYLWIRKGCSYSFSLIQVGDRWAIVTWDGRLYILANMTFHFILKSHFDFFSYYPIQIPPPI